MKMPCAARGVCAALLVLLLGGCLKPPPPPGIIPVQFYLSSWGTDDKVRVASVLAEFERENPDIKVDLICITPTSYNERMQTLMVGGVVPDVMTVDPNVYYEWADRGLLEDVTGLMDGAAREQKMHFMPIVSDELSYRGRYYAVPYMMCGVILQLNLDLFRKGGVPIPPAKDITWDWIAQTAPKLSRRAGTKTAPSEFFFTMPDMTSLLFTFGAKIFDDPANPHKVLVDSQEAAAMCGFVRGLGATKAVISRAEMMTTSNTTVEQMFARGQAPARIHGLWDRPGLYGIPAGFNWDVRPFPAGPHGERITANGAYMLGIPPNAGHPEAARRLLRFFLSPRGINIICRTWEYIPVFREMLDHPGPLPPDVPPSWRYYVDTMESGACRFPVNGPGVAQLRRIIDSRLEQVSAEPDVPIPVILKTLEDEIYRWLDDEKQNGFYR